MQLVTIDALYQLRHDVDAAIAALEPLGPLLQWIASQGRPERPRTRAVRSKPTTSSGNGSAPADEPEPASGGPSESATRICAECGEPFTPRRGGERQLYCGSACRQKAHARRRAAKQDREAAEVGDRDVLPDDRPHSERQWRGDDPRSDASRLRPPALAWEGGEASP